MDNASRVKHATTVKVQGPSRSNPGSQKPKTCFGMYYYNPRPCMAVCVASDNEGPFHAVRKGRESSGPETKFAEEARIRHGASAC
jgi:hypothetical protein